MKVDQTEVAKLYREIGVIIYRRCLALLGDHARAEDATQDIFLKLVREPERLTHIDAALPWLYKVATNHCLNVLRDGARRKDKLRSLELRGESHVDVFPERQLSQRVLERVGRKTQLIAVGVLVDGMEQAEVASMLGISSKTVTRKLARFVDSARRFLTRSTS